jgi:integrase
VDFEKGTIHRPKPKGGEDRAFTVPVSRAVLDILRRRREENAIIFPREGARSGPAATWPAA